MPVIDIPWTLATGEDWRFPEVDGPRPRAQGFINRYVVQVHRAAMTDPVVLRAFFRVANLNQPPASLFRPAILARVLMANRPGRRVPAPARAAVPLVLRYGDCPARRRGHFIATKDIKDVLAEQDDAGRHPKGSADIL